ncbi:hypothetical protein FHG87_018853 [Trinorchestia longiramus]|nr:hypothetical protein FHG87_018853 [Trinorchestia longiramus]
MKSQVTFTNNIIFHENRFQSTVVMSDVQKEFPARKKVLSTAAAVARSVVCAAKPAVLAATSAVDAPQPVAASAASAIDAAQSAVEVVRPVEAVRPAAAAARSAVDAAKPAATAMLLAVPTGRPNTLTNTYTRTTKKARSWAEQEKTDDVWVNTSRTSSPAGLANTRPYERCMRPKSKSCCCCQCLYFPCQRLYGLDEDDGENEDDYK